MTSLYQLLISAAKPRGLLTENRHATAVIVKARSLAEARGLGLEMTEKVYPKSKGWAIHTVDAWAYPGPATIDQMKEVEMN